MISFWFPLLSTISIICLWRKKAERRRQSWRFRESLCWGVFPGIIHSFFYVSFTNTSADFYVFDANTWQQLSTFSIQETVKYADIKSDGSEVLITLGNNDENQLTRRSLKDGSVISTIDRIGRTSLDGSNFMLPYKSAFYSNDGKSIILLTDDELQKISLEDHQVLFSEKISTATTLNKPLVESENGEKNCCKTANGQRFWFSMEKPEKA